MALIKLDNKIPSNLLQDRFLVPPFSILDTKQGYWQKRKREWQAIGIRSEEGRGDNLTFNLGHFNYEDEKKSRTVDDLKIGDTNFDNYREKERIKNQYGKCLPGGIGDKYGRKVQATSIFDPVLCEIAYRWFSNKGDKIIDPFAGGSVRGIVCSALGREYTGVDLSKNQIDANKAQLNELSEKYANFKNPKVNWINGDSMNICELAKGEYNMLFTCPPYADLEVYSDDPRDISNFNDYSEFRDKYTHIIQNACSMLVEDSFAVCVVGEVRDKKGNYYNFVGDTVNAFTQAGLKYYNDIVLVNVVGTLPVRAPKQFNSGRKIGKQHQNVLVFYKGNTKNIKSKFANVSVDDMR